MENKSLPDQLLALFEKKESMNGFLPLLKKIQNFNLFQMNEGADSLYHFSIRIFFYPNSSTFPSVYSRKDIVEYFIRQDYKVSLPNKNKETPLHWACERGETEIAVMLIKRSMNLNLQDYEGNTPLHKAMASPNKNKTIIMNLIKNGCELNKVNSNGETPLLYGLTKGISGIFHPLIKILFVLRKY